MNNLINYYEENKHTNVPYEYSTEDGHKLGFWVSRMRYYKEILTEKQKKEFENFHDWFWRVKGNKIKRIRFINKKYPRSKLRGIWMKARFASPMKYI